MLARFQAVDLTLLSERVHDISDRVQKLGIIQGHTYHNAAVALTALTHRSFLVFWPQVPKNAVLSNECLEFLGDAYVNQFVSWETAALFPHLQEGELSRLRAAFVGTDNLARLSLGLGLRDLVLVAGLDVLSSQKAEKNILADLFEAVTASLLIDAGENVTKSWLRKVFENDFLSAEKMLAGFDLKTQFQEWTQSLVGCPPTYRVVDSVLVGKQQHFVVAGFLGEVELARAQGPNKREASKAVAKILDQMRHSGELTEEKMKAFSKGNT